MKFKVGDKIKVITGKFKSKEGTIKSIDRESLRIKVTGLTQVKHKKPTQDKKGEIKQILTPIHISNIMLLDPKGSISTRIGFKIINNKKIRFSKKTKKEYTN